FAGHVVPADRHVQRGRGGGGEVLRDPGDRGHVGRVAVGRIAAVVGGADAIGVHDAGVGGRVGVFGRVGTDGVDLLEVDAVGAPLDLVAGLAVGVVRPDEFDAVVDRGCH